MTTRLRKLRRLPVAVSNPADNVLFDSVTRRCPRCGAPWSAALGPFGDEVEKEDAHCPQCTQTPSAASPRQAKAPPDANLKRGFATEYEMEHTEKRSLRAAINHKCKECIYDAIGGAGTWREQVTACTSRSCPLYPVRPVTKAPQDPVKANFSRLEARSAPDQYHGKGLA